MSIKCKTTVVSWSLVNGAFVPAITNCILGNSVPESSNFTTTTVSGGSISSNSTVNEDQVTGLINDLSLKAPLNNPSFGGVVTAATFVGNLTGTASAATTLATNGTVSEAQVVNLVNDLAAKAPLSNPNFSGTVTAPTFSGNLTGTASAATTVSGNITESQVTNLVSDLAALAPLANPNFSGTVTATTFAGNLTGTASTASTLTGNIPQSQVTSLSTSLASKLNYRGSWSVGTYNPNDVVKDTDNNFYICLTQVSGTGGEPIVASNGIWQKITAAIPSNPTISGGATIMGNLEMAGHNIDMNQGMITNVPVITVPGDFALEDSTNSGAKVINWISGNSSYGGGPGSVGNMTISSTVSVTSLNGNSTTPTKSLGSGAGGGASLGFISGSTDLGGAISLTTGTSCATTATIVTVNFANTHSLAPFVLISSANAATAALTGKPFVSSSTSGFTLNIGATALPSSTALLWNYVVIGS